ERLAHLGVDGHEARQFLRRPLALAQQRSEGLALDELHTEEGAPVREAADLMRGRDARVLQLAGQLRLFQKTALQVRLARVVLTQDLDGQGAVEIRVMAAEHDTHAAVADFAFQLVAARCPRQFVRSKLLWWAGRSFREASGCRGRWAGGSRI